MIDKIYVAKLGKAVGLKGHVKLFIDSDFPEQFKEGATFTTNKKLELKVQEYLPARGLIKFEKFDDMDTAKKLTNQELFVSEEATKKNCNLGKDEYFWFELINCKIFEDGENLGIVKDIHRYPLDDYMEIKTNEILVKEENLPKTFLIPFIVENYIENVNIETKTIETKNCFEILENS